MTEFFSPTEQIAVHLVHVLCSSSGLNEFFENALPAVAEAFGGQRVILVDYHDNTRHFDILHFLGYATQARFDLQRRLSSSELETALFQRVPYFSGDLKRLFVPLYFERDLEALIIIDADSPIELTPARQQTAQVVSKFVGLLMSSSRLGINQGAMVDLNDLERAREIQLTYLPSDTLETDRYEIYGYNRPASIVGGDYFDYFQLRKQSIQCVLADASGHGLSAALIMSGFRGLLHAGMTEYHDCAELFTTLNRTVHSGSSVVQYLTGVFLDFDETHDRLSYANAGHFDPALIRTDGSVERLSGGGPPLGMFKGSEYSAEAAHVRAGDLLILFTDGLTDLRDSADQFFGEERILRLASENRVRPLKEIASQLLSEVVAFGATAPLEDDLTLFMMRFR